MSGDVPANAAVHCPGTQSDAAGKAAPCAGCPNQTICSSGAAKQTAADPALIDIGLRMASIKHKILILSGKGGVGKSTFSATLARALALHNKDLMIGLLDIDICGPSQPRMMGAENETVHKSGSGWSPVFVDDNLSIMSIGFLLSNKDDAVVWRGPRKNGMIKQFLKDVDWGELDYLIIDTPPGTSDEHISIVQFLLGSTQVDGAILVTTPQEVSLLDVRKEASFCKMVKLPIMGVVQNMSTFVCPNCSHESEIFAPSTGGASQMCKDLGVELMATIPLDSRIAASCDIGESFLEKFPDTPAAMTYKKLVSKIVGN